jgi:diguanylate cyclase (GGDEF)-like protein
MTDDTELKSTKPTILIISDDNDSVNNISYILQNNLSFKFNLIIHPEIESSSLSKSSANLIIISTKLFDENIKNKIKHLKTGSAVKNIPLILITQYNKTNSTDIDLNKLYPIDIIFTPIDMIILTSKVNIFLKLYFGEKKLNFVNSELKQIKQELKDQNKQLKYLALHDALTSTPNRYFFEKSTIQIIKLAKRYQRNFAALLLDIDNFKWINDKFGHNIGDEVLKTVAEKLKSSVRESDLVSRLGGDEFAVILSEIKSGIDASFIAQKMIKSFEMPLRIKNKSIQISLSIGITYFHPSKDKDYEAIMEEADIAMYKAKQNGKNRFEYYTDSFKDQYNYQNTLHYEIQNALGKNEFSLNYQPIMDIMNNKIIGLEALLRWNNPKLGNIPPLNFIPIAEATSIIYDIGLWILESVCQQLAVWKSLGFTNLYASINISPKQLKNIRFGEDLNNITKKYGIKPADIELEITESAFISDSENSMEKYVNLLNDFKTRLAIDDFGAEYSSLGRLGKIPLNTLKIDGSLLDGMEKYPKNKIILIQLFKLAEQLSMKVISEKVETKEQVDFLREHGCYFAQGYYYHKPLKPEAITDLLIVKT